MKKIAKILLLSSLILLPAKEASADTNLYHKQIEYNEKNSINVAGKRYYDTGYVGSKRGIGNDYDGLINDKRFNGRKDVRYKKGRDSNTIVVEEEDIFTKLYVTKDYPKDKIPEEVYNATYRVKNIDKAKNEAELSYISGGDEESQFFKNSKYYVDLNRNSYPLKAGDEVKIWHWFPTNGNEELLIPEIYKIVSLKEEVKNLSKEEREKVLADKLFDNLVESKAASTLINSLPSLDKAYKDRLNATIEKSNKILSRGYKALLAEDKEKSEDEQYAISKIIKIKYDKKLASEKDRTLAYKTYDNIIMAQAARKLLNDYPNASKSIASKLKVELEKSDKSVEKALKALK